LAADALAQGCRVLIGRCQESDSILPFGPWVDACRSGQLGDDEEILAALHPARRAEVIRLLPEAGVRGCPQRPTAPCPCSRAWPSFSRRSPPASRWCSPWRICFGKALALADSRGMRPLVAHCHLGLATLHRGIGDGLTAREHLSTAATMYREMDMRFWLEQAEATTQEG
jgi:hypothetical protein